MADLSISINPDPRRRLREDDCVMSTILQPTEMLRGEKSLHEAARQNNLTKVKKLLSDKVDMNCKNNLDRTALHWAAANGHVDVIQLLVEAGTDVEIKDKYGMGAVHCAAWFGHVEALRALVNGGARTLCQTKQGLNILHCAAQNDHVDILNFIGESLENFKINEVEKNDRTGLHLAAEAGSTRAIEKLLTLKCDVHLKDREGSTAVHLAARTGHVEALKRVLVTGIQIDDRDVHGRTALHLACENGHSDVVDILLEYGANSNAETLIEKQISAIYEHIIYSKLDKAKELTPLHLAASNGNSFITTKLIGYGCNANAQNFQGNTALHLASIGDHPDVARALVEANCELDLPNYGFDENFTNMCCKISTLPQSTFFLRITTAERGKCHHFVNSLPEYGVFLYYSAHNDNSIARTECYIQTKQRLQTALHMAVESGLTEVVEVLLAGAASLEAKEKSGKTALQLASRGAHVALVDTIIKAERYYSTTRDYYNTDLGYIEPHAYLRRPAHPSAEQIKEVLWRLSTKQLKSSEWKKLALHWKFTPEHIQAIEHQYVGSASYKEHGYRMLVIWLHGIRKDENVMKLLFEALVAIDRRNLAEQIRRRANAQGQKACSPMACLIT